VAFLAEPDPKSFADAIIFLMENPQSIREKELNAKRYFEENFELNQMIKSYAEVLHKIGLR